MTTANARATPMGCTDTHAERSSGSWTDRQPPTARQPVALRGVIHIVEDNSVIREFLRALFEDAGWKVLDYISAEEFIASPRPSGEACLVIDIMLPGINGLELLEIIHREHSLLPAIILTGRGDAAAAVAALKGGAADYIEKPADEMALLKSVADAVDQARDRHDKNVSRNEAKACFEKLTPREHEVMKMILDGAPNKIIAFQLGINQRTVENHRAKVMGKTGSASLPELVQKFIEASESE